MVLLGAEEVLNIKCNIGAGLVWITFPPSYVVGLSNIGVLVNKPLPPVSFMPLAHFFGTKN